ncbi:MULTISPECIES: SulP family inorganic anion transporter [Acinetobacter]|uniref:SulP family inorganic anion transporter n=1 Tax=Acinetobacter TaxID=469 RepID=UPI000CEC5C1A|nr:MULTISPECIES: sulfate permease [Acinetobacter]MDM1262703.1 sulfate permease [Acinetobacter indicus]MDM1281072.1 sulfate permease [Acinetobacter indicus]MDM1286390.1 sulfate permease [Acinetobacter indicus]QOW52898.1 sulfate permease [Acinetobacter indicus]QSQ96276.1 sulfate permease [Acinetobacter indicus]
MSDFKSRLLNRLPAWQWLKHYNTVTLKSDLLASLIVIAMLVPQGMAYAMLAGLPPVMGLYASVLPMIIYAFFGSSPTLSIGPVAIISMMTFATLNPLFEVGSPVYIQAACLLALMVGVISLLLGMLRFGFLIQLISHPVIKSFIIASALLIALGQLKFLFNVPLQANNIPEFVLSVFEYIGLMHWESLIFGIASILFLVFMPKFFNLEAVKQRLGASGFIIKSLPLVLVVVSIALVYFFNLQQVGIKTVGEIPSGFPALSMPFWNLELVLQLLPGAAMIAMISFVESLSIAQATALQQRSQLNSNQELIALGAANIGAGLSSAFPVTGSLSRTVVNADAGAKTSMAGVLSSLFIVLVSLYFTGFFRDLPLTVLAATIIVSIWKLVELKPFIDTWRYSKADGLAMWITFFGVLFIDISTGLIIGIVSTFILLLWRISRPHIAEIGLVEGTQHFRNIQRHQVITSAKVLSIRIDEDLTFLNSNTLKGFLINAVSQKPELEHVVINGSSISAIDLSALEMLEDLDNELRKLNIQLHFSEVKGPVMDKLQRSKLLNHLSGKIFLTHYQAIRELSPDIT